MTQPFSIWKSRRLTLLLVAADLVGLSACWFGAYWLRHEVGLLESYSPINVIAPYLHVFPLLLAMWVVNAAFFGLYIHRRRLTSLNTWRRILMTSYQCLLYAMVIGFLFKPYDLGRSIIFISAFFVLLYFYGSRTVLRRLKQAAIREGRGTVRAVIVGTGALALKIRDSLRQHREIGFEFVGFVAHPSEENPSLGVNGEAPLLGVTSDMVDILRREGIEEVFLAIGHLPQDVQLNILNTADVPGVHVHLVSNIFGVLTQGANLEEIGEFPVVPLGPGQLPWHQEVIKQTLDFLLAAIGFVFWIVFLHWWIAIRIKMGSPGPVIFRHRRVGRNGKLFWCYKYRTMRTDADPYAVAPTDPDDSRITPSGRFLRRTSLDELPQLLNVLRGEMSMVGPRPEMPFIVENYEPWQRRRLDVKPGITGLWQVIGRKNLPLHLNMEYDLYYIKNQSLLLDIEILLKTVPAVLMGRGAF